MEAHDIDQRDLAQALHESEEHFRLLVESVQDYAIIMLDEQGYIISWNLGAERNTGYVADEILGKHIAIFYTPEDNAHQQAEQELVQAQKHPLELEGWRVRKDGSRFLAQISLTPLKDTEGKLRGFAKITRNISDRHKMEQRFRQVVESAPNAIVMVNIDGVIEMVNAQTERIFGYVRTELLGKSIEVLIPERFRPQHPGLRKFFFTDPHSRPMGKGRDLYALRKDGSEFPVEIGLNPFESDEGTKVLSAIVDISDRKQKEQKIQAALEEKNILLGEIHHRVKNNLQIVHSLLDLQSTRIQDDAVLEMLRDSQNRIRSMALIHQTLYQSNDFARVNFSNVLEALVPSLVESYGIDSGAVVFSINANEVLLPLNIAIPCGLIVNELVTNALKHAFPEGRQGEIRIELLKQDTQILLSVSDNGAGVPADFELEKRSTLGLQLVSLLADQISAQLAIERANPTRFSLTFSLG